MIYLAKEIFTPIEYCCVDDPYEGEEVTEQCFDTREEAIQWIKERKEQKKKELEESEGWCVEHELNGPSLTLEAKHDNWVEYQLYQMEALTEDELK